MALVLVHGVNVAAGPCMFRGSAWSGGSNGPPELARCLRLPGWFPHPSRPLACLVYICVYVALA